MLCPKERLQNGQQELLGRFLALHPNLAHAYELVQRFRGILRYRLSKDFDQRLSDARDSGFAPFQHLAKTLAADRTAVTAAIELEWGTGQVEGHINRVKLMKRLGCGRAGFPLLRARILRIPFGQDDNVASSKSGDTLAIALDCAPESRVAPVHLLPDESSLQHRKQVPPDVPRQREHLHAVRVPCLPES